MSDGWPLDSLPCDDPRADLLLEDVRGVLADQMAERVAEHLSECTSCRERHQLWVSFVGEARRPDSGLFADHVPSELLVAYSDGSLGGAEAQAIERHVRACGSCALDLRMLDSIDRSIESVTSVPTRRRSAPKRGWLWAYAALLTLMVPAAAILGHWHGEGRNSPTVRSLPPVQTLHLRERGAVSTMSPEVLLPFDEEFVLEFQVPILDESGVRYDAVLLGGGGREIWSEDDLKPADAFGSFRLLLDASRLEPGPHVLRVMERRALGETPSEPFEFSFTLTR